MHSELLYNQWFGKALGFTSAFILAPSSNTLLAVFVITGIVLGHCFDVWAARHASANQQIPNAAKSQGKTSPLTSHQLFLFAALGHIAKQSGTVTRAHIASAEAVMRAMQFSAAQKKDAITSFGAGKATTFKFQNLSRETQPEPTVTSFLVRAMCDMAAITPTDKSLAALVKLAAMLGVQPANVAAFFGQALDNRKAKGAHQQQKQNTRSTPSTAQTPDHHPYQLLGIAPGSSASEAKRAYRKLISKSHPDKLPPNASEQEILAATQRMVELREALEAIQQKK